MLVLVLDTSTPAVTAALVDVPGRPARASADRAGGAVPDRAGGAISGNAGGTVRAERRVVDGRAHGELLAPQIAGVLAEVGARPRDLIAIVVGLGPGPFTGLRVGLATAASMGQALGIPTYGICSLDALGFAAGTGHVLAATDARRREIYYATYTDGARTSGPSVARPADVSVTATRAVGEGALTYVDVLGLPVDENLRYPPAGAFAALAAERVRGRAPGERLTPLYLRRPDAAEPAGRKPALR